MTYTHSEPGRGPGRRRAAFTDQRTAAEKTYDLALRAWKECRPDEASYVERGRELLDENEDCYPEIERRGLLSLLRDIKRADTLAAKNTDAAVRARASKRAAEDETIERASEILERRVLDWVMPNGKALRDCTFREVGGWGLGLSRLAKRGKPNEKVGEVLTDAQARALLFKA